MAKKRTDNKSKVRRKGSKQEEEKLQNHSIILLLVFIFGLSNCDVQKKKKNKFFQRKAIKKYSFVFKKLNNWVAK